MQLRNRESIIVFVELKKERVEWASSCAGKRRTLGATIVTIFSHMTTDGSVLSSVTRFLNCFFCKSPQIWTSNFRKVVRQHTEGMVGSIIWVLLEISYISRSERIFVKVIAMNSVFSTFLGTQCSFTVPNVLAIFRRGPQTGASNAGGF